MTQNDFFPAMYGGMNPAINRASEISPETNDPRPDNANVMLEIAILKSVVSGIIDHLNQKGEVMFNPFNPLNKPINEPNVVEALQNTSPLFVQAEPTEKEQMQEYIDNHDKNLFDLYNDLRLQIEDLKTRVELLQDKVKGL